jgi:hypothetical protein
MSSSAHEATPVIRVRGKVLPPEYVEAGRSAYRQYYRRQRIYGVIAAPVLLAVAAGAIWYARLHEILTLGALPILLLLAVGMGYLVFAMFAEHYGPSFLRQQARNLMEVDESELEFDPGGMRVRAGPLDWRAEWSAFTLWGETPATIWLWSSGLSVLPKRLFSNEDLDTLRRWMLEKITSADRRRGFPVEPSLPGHASH